MKFFASILFILVLFVVKEIVMVSPQTHGSNSGAGKTADSPKLGVPSLANITDYPFIVSVARYDSHQCVGLLIRPEWVVISAHCLEHRVGDIISVYNVIAGDNNAYVYIQTDLKGSQHSQRITGKFYLHENYDEVSRANDIGLIQLSTASVLSSHVQIAKLPSQNDIFPTACNFVGWGGNLNDKEIGLDKSQDLLDLNGSIIDPSYNYSLYKTKGILLRQVQLPIVEHKKCIKQLKDAQPSRGADEHSTVCAGLLAGNDTCRSNAGGIMVCNGVVTALPTWGMDCHGTYPGVYTKLFNFIKWIDDKIKEHSG